MASADAPLIAVRALHKHFRAGTGRFQRLQRWIQAVDGIDLDVYRGETLGLVGESGCGKTTLSRMLLRLEVPTSGTIRFSGRDISNLSRDETSQYRRDLQVVFQDPGSSLNPRMRVEEIVGEPILANETMSRRVVKERVVNILAEVGLPPGSGSLFPHEFSGGQRQRIAIARALVSGARCVILDEPVSALDISVRAQVLNLLRQLQRRRNLTYIVIAHDLAAIRYLSSRIAIMYLGKFVELVRGDAMRREPLHPYARALFSAALPLHPDAPKSDLPLFGEIPSAIAPPSGCRFHPRCPIAERACSELEPIMLEVEPDHFVACHVVSRRMDHQTLRKE